MKAELRIVVPKQSLGGKLRTQAGAWERADKADLGNWKQIAHYV
jgi:hypothetical protein